MTPMILAGLGAYAPREHRPSQALDAVFGQPAGWTETQFGIAARGVAAPDETTSMMGAEAARRALAMAGWAEGEFDVLIGACAVMEQPIPGASVLIQQALGLGKSGIWAFDVNQTCLSFVTALDVAAMGFETRRFRRALIVSSDIASAGLDWDTPASAAIFGDGAAAVCLEAGTDPDGPGLLARGFETYGEGKDLATLRSGGTRIRVEHGLEALTEGARFHMDAFGIFKAAARALPALIDRVLGEAGLTRETVDVIVGHQASAPGLEHVRRLMGGDPARVIDIFATHGNQIAASLPTVLAEARVRGLLAPGRTVLLLGTAAGVSAAAMVLRT
ncbi:3-oxoacyl-[acyl-carrier-protein] synthase III C-terminal domain-containing protein [Brevundimonas sp.]|uniref:3-oxoacyl-[acyl-carrier-protein] synthase III C-terminal domain-containing protein n=1 Tax=Brevundimonas sp. TaxID=1871086 RepID=UPI002737DF6E|nr:3-oxoacyl-[acyl-carrier-protein] synthase III C-terminal domain-containing protein [Brevundimonas sp.]MDP3802396.1 3-oxoacyl-[acyl-carrier-protein] synthase III C-terminal domain-containing protein [Brevundimonas sp.]